MDQSNIHNFIIKAAKECPNKDGWFHLADFGSTLRTLGFDFKSQGYFKLSHFLGDYSDLVELKQDESHEPPVILGKLIEETRKVEQADLPRKVLPPVQPKLSARKIEQADSPRKVLPTVQTKLIPKSPIPANALFNWAYVDIKKVLKQLKDIALEERWSYSEDSENGHQYPILYNYLIYTFYRLTQENGKIIEKEDFAVFNTGLVDKRYEAIYALFQKNKNKNRPKPWEFADFCIAAEDRSGKTLVRKFNKLPEPAQYFNFNNPHDILYNTSSEDPQLDSEHIIVENTDRLPLDFLNENAPKDFLIKDTTKMTLEEKNTYFEQFGKAIKEDSSKYRCIKNRLDDSLKLALKRVKWNYKTAIPFYYPTKNVISLLLPLALIDENKIDIALVVEKQESGNYIGHTILPLDLAYSNARLVCRPDSDWLMSQNIRQDNSGDE